MVKVDMEQLECVLQYGPGTDVFCNFKYIQITLFEAMTGYESFKLKAYSGSLSS